MTLAKRIIPVMLVKGRTLVKGRQFAGDRSVGHAKQSAMVNAARGVDELCILDIAATAEGRGPDLELITELSSGCFIPICVGGGIRTVQQIDDLLRRLSRLHLRCSTRATDYRGDLPTSRQR